MISKYNDKVVKSVTNSTLFKNHQITLTEVFFACSRRYNIRCTLEHCTLIEGDSREGKIRHIFAFFCSLRLKTFSFVDSCHTKPYFEYQDHPKLKILAFWLLEYLLDQCALPPINISHNEKSIYSLTEIVSLNCRV